MGFLARLTVVFMSWDMVLAKRWQLVLNLIRSKIPIRYIRCLIVGGFDSLFFTWTMNVLADECCLVRNAAHSHADTCQIANFTGWCCRCRDFVPLGHQLLDSAYSFAWTYVLCSVFDL